MAAVDSTAGELEGGRTAWSRNLAAPIRGFFHAETSGAMLLVGAAVVALLWANSPWSHSYTSLWHTRLALVLGHHQIGTDLRGWVNSGLMTFFFLVVGLEAKRELDLGELRERNRLAIPVLASLGGMLGATAVYMAINAGGPGAHGWGAAISTDTALALGILTLLSRGRAIRMRVFLLTVVVIDDLVALLVIALFYTHRLDGIALAVAIGLFGALVALRFAPGEWRRPAAVIIGVGVWLALFESGIDPVIAGLVVGLITSAYPPSREELERSTELTRSFREQPTPELAYSARASLTSAISLNERLQYRLLPWTSQVIVPLFALANAGVHFGSGLLSDALTSPITLGIVAAYALGKPAGIATATWIATRPMFGSRRLSITWPAVITAGAAAGAGFTVSLLVASLAFTGRSLEEAKVGVLASVVVATASAFLGRELMRRLPAELRARQLGATADQIIDLADDIDPERDHIRGAVDAPVTLVEYGDFECPYCGSAERRIEKLLNYFGDELRYVWRHLPLNDVHPAAQLAAEASEASGGQGRFWEMHDRLLADQDHLSLSDIHRHASEIGLDVDRFDEDLRRRRYAPRVAEDVRSADASGVSGTPSFFINGRRHRGVYDVDTLTRDVKAAARTQRAASGAQRELAGAGGGTRD